MTTNTEIREAPTGLWLKPNGFDYSCVFVSKPYDAQDQANPMIHHPTGALSFPEIIIPAGIDISPRERMTPQQARALAAALRRAADLSEKLQHDFEMEKKKCTQKPKPETSSSAGRSQAAHPGRLK